MLINIDECWLNVDLKFLFDINYIFFAFYVYYWNVEQLHY